MVSQVFFENANNNYQNAVKDYNAVKERVDTDNCYSESVFCPSESCKPLHDRRKNRVDKASCESNESIFTALKTIAPVRRAISAEEEVKQGNIIPALGLAAYFLTYLREDWRDIEEAVKQVKALCKGKKYVSKYLVPDGVDYKEYQHAFSSIRGTGWLENWVKKGLANGSKWAHIVVNLDGTLSGTNNGARILSKLCETPDKLSTKIENITSSKDNPMFVNAFKFKGKGKFPIFGELTARAMTRTTKLGILLLALIELPKIIKALTQGETAGEQVGNTARQMLNSAVKIGALTAGIAYTGGLGQKLAGPGGSLAGMGIGAVFGSLTAKKFEGLTS